MFGKKKPAAASGSGSAPPKKKMGLVRKFMLAATGAGAVGAGGAYLYQNHTEEDIYFRLDQTRQVYAMTCTSKVADVQELDSVRNEKGEREVKRGTVELEAPVCTRTLVANELVTDKGTLVNEMAALRGKFQDSVESVQGSLDLGKDHSATVYGRTVGGIRTGQKPNVVDVYSFGD